MCGTHIHRVVLTSASSLRHVQYQRQRELWCYGVCGTELGYGGTRGPAEPGSQQASPCGPCDPLVRPLPF
eukprot:3881706-Rhodomonas_salina.1